LWWRFPIISSTHVTGYDEDSSAEAMSLKHRVCFVIEVCEAIIERQHNRLCGPLGKLIAMAQRLLQRYRPKPLVSDT